MRTITGTRIATSINEILATRAKTKFAYRIDFDTINEPDDMKKWCEERCSGIWRAHFQYATYFQFENETDALMFSLRWGGTQGKSLR